MTRPLQELIILLFLVIAGIGFYISWRTDTKPCVWKTISEPTCTPEPGQIMVRDGDEWRWIEGPTK